MTRADENLMVIQNFILHITGVSNGDLHGFVPFTITPEDLYTLAVDYIEDDHADGKGNPENNLTERDKEIIAFIVNIVEKEGIIEKKGSMQLPSPLSTEIKYALESRGYEVTNTKVNLK
jgi:hypothetical protein